MNGISLLFDNPESQFTEQDGLRFVTPGSCPALYRTIYDAIAPAFEGAMLPGKRPEFYHVTVLGLLNQGNSPSDGWLTRLPGSLCEDHPLHELVAPLQNRPPFRATFSFDRLANWHDACLAAVLKPANGETVTFLQDLDEDVRRLADAIRLAFGIEVYRKLVSHVTLRHFDRRPPGAAALAEIESVSQRLSKGLEDRTITFESIGMYGFTKPTELFKLAGDPSNDKCG